MFNQLVRMLNQLLGQTEAKSGIEVIAGISNEIEALVQKLQEAVTDNHAAIGEHQLDIQFARDAISELEKHNDTARRIISMLNLGDKH